MKGMVRIGLALGMVCLIAAVSLSAVNYLTEGEIERRKALELQENLKVVFPAAERFTELPLPAEIPKKDGISILAVYEAFIGERSEGYAFRVSTMGYGGEMILLLGIAQGGKITGLQVLEHQETPGLGSNITGDAFRSQFVGKSIDDPFEARKDIQAITGATISTEAVARVCRGVIAYFKEGEFKP